MAASWACGRSARRALGCMRVEKGYGSWSREYSPEWYPTESGLAGLVKADKPAFIGKAAFMRINAQPPRQLLRCFTVDTPAGLDGADAAGGEPIYRHGRYVGRITSGGYSFTHQVSVALGYVDAADAVADDGFEVAVLGRPHKARLLAQPLFDPQGSRLRA